MRVPRVRFTVRRLTTIADSVLRVEVPNRFVQFSVRRLLLAVVVVAIVAGVAAEGERGRRRAEAEFHRAVARSGRRRAAEKAERKREEVLKRIRFLKGRITQQELGARKLWDRPEQAALSLWHAEESRTQMVHAVRVEEHYAQLRAKYLDAADHPWLPVAPDPPEPE
jgi:hypothetical protein